MIFSTLFTAGWIPQQRNRKRLLLLGLCAAMVIGIAGCGKYQEQHDGNTVPDSPDVSDHTAAEENNTGDTSDQMVYSPQDEITMWEYIDLSHYTPFAPKNRLETLDEPATLRFAIGDTLPKLDGTNVLYPAYAAIAQATYPDYLNEGTYKGTIGYFVTHSSTERAFQQLADRECDMIFVPESGEEQEAYAREMGVELVYTPVCREALVFFVHPDNPIDGLTLDELRGIYSGNITEWSQLDVPGLGNILAYQRDEEYVSQTTMKRLVMQGTPLMTPPMDQEAYGWAYEWDYIDLVTDYQNRPGAIGYALRFYCSAPRNKDINVKLLTVDGVAPTAENMESGAYPLTVTFYAVTRSDANESTRALLDWICGEQGQALVEKAGYVRASGKQ